MNSLDLLGIAVLGITGMAFFWLGRRAQKGITDLNLGRYNAKNTPRDAWDRMNRSAGGDLSSVGYGMVLAAIALAALTTVLPAGLAGVLSLAAASIVPLVAAWIVARRAAQKRPKARCETDLRHKAE